MNKNIILIIGIFAVVIVAAFFYIQSSSNYTVIRVNDTVFTMIEPSPFAITQLDPNGNPIPEGMRLVFITDKQYLTTVYPGPTCSSDSSCVSKYCYNSNTLYDIRYCMNPASSYCPGGKTCCWGYSSTCSSGQTCSGGTCHSPTSTCGDDTCQSSETPSSCSSDCCSTTYFCYGGDSYYYGGSSNNHYDCGNNVKAEDCSYGCDFATGKCKSSSSSHYCGDGTCDSDESVSLCPADCSSTPPPSTCKAHGESCSATSTCCASSMCKATSGGDKCIWANSTRLYQKCYTGSTTTECKMCFTESGLKCDAKSTASYSVVSGAFPPTPCSLYGLTVANSLVYTTQSECEGGIPSGTVTFVGKPELKTSNPTVDSYFYIEQNITTSAAGSYGFESGAEKTGSLAIISTSVNFCDPNQLWYASILDVHLSAGAQTLRFGIKIPKCTDPSSNGQDCGPGKYNIHTTWLKDNICGGAYTNNPSTIDVTVADVPSTPTCTTTTYSCSGNTIYKVSPPSCLSTVVSTCPSGKHCEDGLSTCQADCHVEYSCSGRTVMKQNSDCRTSTVETCDGVTEQCVQGMPVCQPIEQPSMYEGTITVVER